MIIYPCLLVADGDFHLEPFPGGDEPLQHVDAEVEAALVLEDGL